MATKKPNSFTIHDVGKLAGVSGMTVSRALNKPEQVSPETLKKIQEAVRRTGFVPNQMATSLRSSSAKLVSALVPTLVGPVFQETVKALNETLEARGYQLMIGQSGYDGSREQELIDAVIRRRPDGIVLIGIVHSQVVRNQLISSGIPVVETWDLTPNPIDMLVGFSHALIGESVAQFLHRKGHTKVGLITANDSRARRRGESFCRISESLGAEPVPVAVSFAPSTLGAGRAGLTKLLAEMPDLQAVFCSSDLLAVGVVFEAQKRGIRIPADIAVIGLGDQEFAESVEPALSTVRIDGTRIGSLAAGLVVDRVQGKDIEDHLIDVGFSIIERISA